MLKRIVALQSVVVLALAMLPLKVGAATTSLELVSQSTTGVESQGVNLPGNVDYHAADVSGDGRYIAFVSGDSNLGGQAGLNAVYVRDRQLNTTSVANVGSSGQQDDGYFGNVDLELSDNGGRMMFQSRATNLDPGTTNGNTYCYVRDFTTGQTQLVSIDAAGSPVSVRFCAVSGDGNVVAFSQLAGWVYVRDLSTAITTALPIAAGSVPSLSADGRYVVAGSPVPYDRATNSFVVVPGGTPAGATISFVDSISSDGRYVFFTSATPLGSGSPASCSPTVCVYRQDVADGNISFIHVGQVGVRSADGNVVAYLEGSGDVYVKNFYANTTYLLIDHSFWQNTASDIYGLSADGLALGVMTSALSDFTQAYVTSGSRPVADTTPPTLGMHLWVNNPKHSPKLPV